ncbi:MAG: NADPH:quinone oxidoreductase family protein [Burkholderiales bacterium]|nr:NADPH:quinone oxidoreductase family protein [Burkholderiales bacterium]
MAAPAMRGDLPPGQRVVIRAFGETPLDALEHHAALEDMAAPDPAALAPDEILLAIKSCGVAWVDLLMTSGQYQHMAAPPYCPGMEYSGVVVAAGAAVDPAQVKAGDAVFSDFILAGPRAGGRYQSSGGFASYAVLPAGAVRRVPAGFSFDEACNLLGNYETAWHCLIARGQLRAGETVLITGASGASGMAAVQVARLLGATVIATGRSDAKLAVVKAHGADHVINTGNEDGSPGVRRFRDEVKALTGGRGVDVVFDAVGGDTSLECLRCAAFGARFLIVGWTSTPFVARGRGQRGAPNANQLPTNLIQMKGLSVLGSPAVISVAQDPSIRPPRVAQIMQWVAEGRIRPHISHRYPLAEFKQAMLARWNGEVIGGCVLHP